MTDKTSETKSAICGDGMCPYVPCAKYPKCKHGQDYLVLKTPYSTQFIKGSVGKAEDDGKIFSDKDRSDKVMTPMGVDSVGNDNPASSAPKSEPCTHEPYWILWIEGENKLIHCSKCNGTWNIEKFAEEIRQQTRKETAREIINDINNWETIACGMWEVKQQIKKWIEKYGVDA